MSQSPEFVSRGDATRADSVGHEASSAGTTGPARSVSPANSGKLRDELEVFRQLAEHVDDVCWVVEVGTSRILFVNAAFETMWGLSRERVYKDPYTFLESVHPDDRQRLADSLTTMAQGGYDQVYRIVRAGDERSVRIRAFPIYNEAGEVYRVGGFAEDITESRRAEVELHAERRFLEHLLQLQDRERRLLAYDIHDGFVQSVTAALMHLEGAGAADDMPPSARERLKLPVQLLRDSIDEARRMISGLRPPILDEQGLVAAIEYLIKEGQRTQNVKVIFVHDVQFTRLEGLLEGVLFRIVQEALSNVYRHSQAKLAQILLKQEGDLLRLVIEDSGRGFDTASTPVRHFGLRGIRERARLFGGTATVESTLGLGTRVTVELPLHPTQTRAVNPPGSGE